jgi:hypothetical protein
LTPASSDGFIISGFVCATAMGVDLRSQPMLLAMIQ